MPTLDKFFLKVFNKLLHNCEVSKLLVVRFLLDLLDYYTSNFFVKLINILVLKIKFLLLIFEQNFNTTNDVVYINSYKVQPYFIFRHYYYKSLCFLQFFLYEYYKAVLVVKYERK